MPPAEPSMPLRFDLEVPPDGRIEMQVPLPAGAHVTVYIIEQSGELADLLSASASSLDFWDSPEDDEDWNNA